MGMAMGFLVFLHSIPSSRRLLRWAPQALAATKCNPTLIHTIHQPWVELSLDPKLRSSNRYAEQVFIHLQH